uniref:Notch receptor 2 n=1 Tax=Salmo trutta TaxID=8032 RepID=A0A673W043_SALTR
MHVFKRILNKQIDEGLLERITKVIHQVVSLQCLDAVKPCVNNATCATFTNGTGYCRCAAGFLGDYCHHKDPCHPGYCLNGGNCSVAVSGIPGSPTCSCPLGYTGQHCQTPQNSTCYPNNPCANQGVCTLLSLDKYKCQCAHGWTGMRCNREDSCLSGPCANGGTCSSLSGGKFSCTCPPGYWGPRCLNDTDECAASAPVCQNQGGCVNTPGSYRCNCAPGFTGRQCETPYIPCSPSPCLNGGTCRPTSETSYWCHCLPVSVFLCLSVVSLCVQIGGVFSSRMSNCFPPTGQFCTEDVDECRLQPNTCQNGGTCSNIQGSYTCVCVNGFEGTHCEIDINECASSPCLNQGTCLDQVKRYVCQCPLGFSGEMCQIDIDECSSTPCLNGAKCIDRPNGYECECAEGFSGPLCKENIDDCDPEPCHHGVCRDGIATFSCDCDPGYTGSICNVQVMECHSNPCQNRGRCIDLVNKYQCNCLAGTSDLLDRGPIFFAALRTSVNTECGPCCKMSVTHPGIEQKHREGREEQQSTTLSSYCSCPCGSVGRAWCVQRQGCGFDSHGGPVQKCMKWVNCEFNVDDCASNPCEYGECQDGINEYKCVCAPGYTGAKCDVDIHECNSSPCMSGGTCVDKVNGFICQCPPGTHGPLCHSGTDHCAPQPCVHGDCVEQQSGYNCECDSGWVGQHCDQEKDECQSSPCQHSGTCVDRLNGYTCQCRPGFTGLNQGKHCEEELVPCASHPCERGGVCQPTPDYTFYTCRCPSGWQGPRCTEDVDECRKNPCQNRARCINSQGSYVCKCRPGYSGLNCQTNIDDCSPNPCLNGGSCVDEVGGFSCDCRQGFDGERCEAEVDECASQPCQNGAVCRDYVNSFVCVCRPGFDGILCEHNIPECTESSCLNNGTCVDDINTFSCRCRPGFYGTFCEYEQNECDSQPCKNGGTCTDGLGSYRCTCPVGYNGQNCQNFVNLCSQPLCQNGGSCSQSETTWLCHCPVGWTGMYCDVPNMSCQDYAARNGIQVELVCKHSGRCVNVGNAHQCQCLPGYTGSYCNEMVDECLSNPCRNGATCMDYQGTYECMCKAGYQGVNCEYDVDECHSNPCHHGGTCINLINRFSCACPPGTNGVQCEVNVDDCAPKPGSWELRCLNGGQCVDGVGRYTCSCPPGFAGEHCEGDVNECLSGPCHSPGSLDCVQLANDYQCRCRLGYTGRHCESMVDLCQSKPCHNSGTCSMNMSSVHGYTCICQPGFTGFNCGEVEGYNCAKLRCQNGGHCQETQVGRPHCRCQPGFSGPRCETVHSCQNRPCLNGGTCMKDPHYQYSCHCPAHFSGRHCENVIFDPSPSTPASCPYVECEQHSGDKVCDPQCNSHECQWDGGDCSLHWRQPWVNCTAPVACWELFRNGRCDPECDNSGCLFDSFECQESAQSYCKYDKYCAAHYANKICDKGCNTEACGWDGLDCSGDTPAEVADGTLVIVVLLQPEELMGDMRGFLRSLGTLLHTNLRVKMDDQQKPMLYPYYGLEHDDGNEGQPSTMMLRGKRELDKEVIGSKVYLEIDNRKCSERSMDCFSSTELAASFIAAEYLKSELPYPVVSVNSDPTEPHKPPFLLYLAVGAAVIILLILVLGVLAAKRKRKHGILWLPDGFLAKKDDKRREPKRQKLRLKWHPIPCITEDKPLLPMGVDGGVDRREWTLQHHKAADISLTPPQTDLEADCLDVNVKGPDGFTPLMLASLRNGGASDCGLQAEEEEESGGDEPCPNAISDLITQGATLMAQTDRTGETALHLAARYARADAAKRLLDAGADANAHDNMGRTPLHAAVAADAQGVFQILIRNRATELDARMNDGTTPLILAARLAVEGMVEELVHCHADINAVDDHGKSALHWAAAVNNVEATLVLLKNGANRDMQDNKEQTPLFLAAREGSFEAAQVLLDHYSNRDITDHLDRLPRDTAQERMHHDIVRLLDQYNLVHSPHNGPNHMGGGHSSLVCGGNGAGYMGMRPGPQGKKSRRGGAKVGGVGGATAKELKDMKAKRRKKPTGGEGPAVGGASGNGTKAAGGLLESSVTMSPVDSLESPHLYIGDAAGASKTTNSPLLGSPSSRPLLPPVSHMLGQQQSWVGLKHGYGGHMFSLLPQQMGSGHPSMSQHHGQGLLTPMNVTMSREQLPPIVTFQMMAPGGGQALLKQPQPGQVQSQGQNQGQPQSQQGPTHLHCPQGMLYQMPNVSLQHSLSHSLPHPHGLAHGMVQDGQSRQQLPPYQAMQSPVDKYPTPPSQHSYATAGSEGTTPGYPAHPPSEHPYLTPSPESPDPWSSSSPHSNSDWSDVTTSPTPLGNPHALPPLHHTHIPEQLQPQSQQTQQNPQQPQRGNMQVFA